MSKPICPIRHSMDGHSSTYSPPCKEDGCQLWVTMCTALAQEKVQMCAFEAMALKDEHGKVSV